jgi:uncharacterized protein
VRAVFFGGVSACMLLCIALDEAVASIVYATAGSTYSQNFNSLPNTPTNVSVQATRPWSDDTTQTTSNTSIPGWYLYHVTTQAEGGANGHQRIRYGTGSANTGSFWSFGASGSTERALGSVASNTTADVMDGGEQYIGLRLTNSTGLTLNTFRLSYDGEQWRDGGAAVPNAQSITFGYKVAAVNVQETGFTAVPTLNFVSPVFTNTGGGAAVDGNAAGKVAIGTVNVSGVNWAPGTDLWLRWTDVNNSGNDHGLAIDNLSFTAAIPEPRAVLFGGLVCGMVGLGAAWRRFYAHKTG